MILLLSLLVLSSCTPQETAEQQTEEEFQIIIHPTTLAPLQEFEVAWHVPLDLDLKTGIIYDQKSQKPDFYSYEFTSDILLGEGPADFKTKLTAFETGEIYLRPFVISNNQLYYGEELSIRIN